MGETICTFCFSILEMPVVLLLFVTVKFKTPIVNCNKKKIKLQVTSIKFQVTTTWIKQILECICVHFNTLLIELMWPYVSVYK